MKNFIFNKKKITIITSIFFGFAVLFLIIGLQTPYSSSGLVDLKWADANSIFDINIKKAGIPLGSKAKSLLILSLIGASMMFISIPLIGWTIYLWIKPFLKNFIFNKKKITIITSIFFGFAVLFLIIGLQTPYSSSGLVDLKWADANSIFDINIKKAGILLGSKAKSLLILSLIGASMMFISIPLIGWTIYLWAKPFIKK